MREVKHREEYLRVLMITPVLSQQIFVIASEVFFLFKAKLELTDRKRALKVHK